MKDSWVANYEKQNIKASLEVMTIPIVNEVFLGLLKLEKQLVKPKFAFWSLSAGFGREDKWEIV